MAQQPEYDLPKLKRDFIRGVIFIGLFFVVHYYFLRPTGPVGVEREVRNGPSFFIIRFPRTESGFHEEIVIMEHSNHKSNKNDKTEVWATRGPVNYKGRTWDPYTDMILSLDEQQTVEAVYQRWCNSPPNFPPVADGDPFYDVGLDCGFFKSQHVEIPAALLPDDMQELIAMIPPHTQRRTLPTASPDEPQASATAPTKPPTRAEQESRPTAASAIPEDSRAAPPASPTPAEPPASDDWDATALLDLHPMLAGVLFVGLMWVPALLVLSGISGWATLAKSYRWTQPAPAGDRWFERGRVGIIGYNSTLRFALLNEGFFLGQVLPFRPGHPPLFIPWSAIQTVYQAEDNHPYLQLVVDTPAGPVPITLAAALVDPARDHLPAAVVGFHEVTVAWQWLLVLVGMMLVSLGWMWLFVFRFFW